MYLLTNVSAFLTEPRTIIASVGVDDRGQTRAASTFVYVVERHAVVFIARINRKSQRTRSNKLLRFTLSPFHPLSSFSRRNFEEHVRVPSGFHFQSKCGGKGFCTTRTRSSLQVVFAPIWKLFICLKTWNLHHSTVDF